MTSNKNWGPFVRDVCIQHSAGPLSDHSFEEADVDAYKTDGASQFLGASIINVEDDIYHTNRTQTLGSDLPNGLPESDNNESQLLKSGPDFCTLHPHWMLLILRGLPYPMGGVLSTIYNNKQAYFISFDIETGDEYAGIVQLFAHVIRTKLMALGSSTTKDNAEFVVDDDIFDSYYVNPKVSAALWDDRSIAAHCICPHKERITGADEIRLVWHRFLQWISKHVPPGEYGTLVAWNGAACDLKWLWRLTQAPNSKQSMSPQLLYFINPYQVIESYASCRIDKKTSKLETYQLGAVWKYLDVEHRKFNNALNSRDDVIAHSYVFTHADFIPFINWSKSVRSINEMFIKLEQSAFWKKMEPLREVHLLWKEVTKENKIKWEPRGLDTYGSAGGGPKCGPSNYILMAARNATTLADIFLSIVPMTVFVKIATMTEKYYYKDWVIHKSVNESRNNPKKWHVLIPLDASAPGARCCAANKEKKYSISPGFILAWIAILVINGAHLSLDKKSSHKLCGENLLMVSTCHMFRTQ